MNDASVSPTPPIETEIKFSIEPKRIERFTRMDFIAQSIEARRRLVATYFDTAENELGAAGYSLRIRSAAGGDIQTLKGPRRTEDGLLSRAETETPLSDTQLDMAALRDALPRALHDKVVGGLRPRFSVIFDRTEWLVTRPDGALIVVSLDTGWLEAGAAREPIAEVEFELRRGDRSALFAIAREAVNMVPLHLELRSKAERGYRLAGWSGGHAMTTGGLQPGQSAIQGTRRLAAQLLEDIVRQRRMVMEAGEADAVHRLRDALRRLRSLLAFSAGLMDKDSRRGIAGEARRAFHRLGTLRDLDIFALALAGYGTLSKDVIETIAGQRADALALARRRLRSRDFASAMLDLLAFVELAEQPGAPEPGRAAAEDVLHRARHILRRRWREVRRGKRPSRLGERTRHRLRIDAKTFRHACDFYGPLFEGDDPLDMTRMLSSLRKLQDRLGDLNDRRMVRRLSCDYPGTTGAKGLGLPRQEDDRAMILAADKAFKALRRRHPFWQERRMALSGFPDDAAARA